MRECRLCPRACGAKRLEGKFGVCRLTDTIVIASNGPHYGEEAPLVGFGGSGTIFFSSCNLKCQFCQNYDISQLRYGRVVSIERLAGIMLDLQQMDCQNINLVTPTHCIASIVEALLHAINKGLKIPLVYNCGGYESLEVLTLLDGIIDIYMPDIKYGCDEYGKRYSGVKNYWSLVRPAVREMQRQVGDLKMNGRGVAEQGLLIRHLVLPNRIAGSQAVLEFIAREISRDAYVNIMDQYRPMFHAGHHPELNRGITEQEYDEAIRFARQQGLHRGFS
ncbi:MAG: radical SAM protein [bacterium]